MACLALEFHLVPLCRCGREAAWTGLCEPCYWRARDDRRRYDGQREATLARDGGACRACGATKDVLVHHRTRGQHAALVTVCRPCHALIHHLAAITRLLPEPLVDLWAEQHPAAPRQLQLNLAA